MGWSALPDELRRRLGRVERVERPPQGDAAEVALVEAAAGRFAVKRAVGARGAKWLGRENQALTTLADTALPVPRAHAFLCREASGGDDGDEAWLLMDHNGRAARRSLPPGPRRSRC